MKQLKYILSALAVIVAFATCEAATFEVDIEPPGIVQLADTPVQVATLQGDSCDCLCFTVEQSAKYDELIRTGDYFQELRTIVKTKDKAALERLHQEHKRKTLQETDTPKDRGAFRRARDGLRCAFS